jgi:hypothetical protein
VVQNLVRQRQVERLSPREGRPGEDLRGVGVAVRLVAVAPARREVAAHEAEARFMQPEPDGHGTLPLLHRLFVSCFLPAAGGGHHHFGGPSIITPHLVAKAAHDAAADAGDAGAADEAAEVGAHPHREQDAHHLLAHHAPVVPAGQPAAAAVPQRVHLLPAAAVA